MAFRELKGTGGSNFFKWENRAYGKTFEGQFRGLATGDYQGKVTFHAIFVDAQGKTIKVNTPTILRDKLGEADAGMNLRITYTGDLQGKGGKTGAKEFKVEVIDTLAPNAAQAPVQPVPTSAAAAPGTPAATAAPDPQAALFAQFLAMQAQAKAAAAPAASEYDGLIAKLREKDPKGAPALEGALAQIYPDADARTKALRDHLKAQGVAV